MKQTTVDLDVAYTKASDVPNENAFEYDYLFGIKDKHIISIAEIIALNHKEDLEHYILNRSCEQFKYLKRDNNDYYVDGFMVMFEDGSVLKSRFAVAASIVTIDELREGKLKTTKHSVWVSNNFYHNDTWPWPDVDEFNLMY